jgi:hypothetical protein
MSNFMLILDCDMGNTYGNFTPYKNVNPGQPLYPTDPMGRVWWEEQPGSWAPSYSKKADHDGDPDELKFPISNGNLGSVALRDLNNKIDTISMVVVFGKDKTRKNPKSIASPYDTKGPGTVIN